MLRSTRVTSGSFVLRILLSSVGAIGAAFSAVGQESPTKKDPVTLQEAWDRADAFAIDSVDQAALDDRTIAKIGKLVSGVRYKFHLSAINYGSKEWAITNIRSGCDCLGIYSSAKTVLPGDQLELVVVFSAPTIEGEFGKTIVVEGDRGRFYSFAIEGECVPLFTLSPKRLLASANGQIKDQSLRIDFAPGFGPKPGTLSIADPRLKVFFIYDDTYAEGEISVSEFPTQGTTLAGVCFAPEGRTVAFETALDVEPTFVLRSVPSTLLISNDDDDIMTWKFVLRSKGGLEFPGNCVVATLPAAGEFSETTIEIDGTAIPHNGLMCRFSVAKAHLESLATEKKPLRFAVGETASVQVPVVQSSPWRNE
jgi:hypothetical protein